MAPRFRADINLDFSLQEASGEEARGSVKASGAEVVVALERIGYRTTMGVALVFLVGAVERKGIAAAIVFATAMAAGSFFLFDTVLRVPLPRGPFGF